MELIYSARKIFSQYLQEGQKFVIPSYQRGYKWNAKDIGQLLDDINAFDSHGDDDVFYCLQNITLVKNGDNYNVVDGQQRLTTLTLILSYLEEKALVEGKIEYGIRLESQDFLSKIISGEVSSFKNNKDTLLEWEDLGIDMDDEFDYQDIFYMYNAYLTIHKWFTNHSEERNAMTNKILDKVKLIINLPQISSTQELELFDNLNGKRVSLDGADLIRAMIITRVARKDVEDVDDDIKRDVLLNENRVKNGIKLDVINNWWRDPEKQNYYGFFVKNINSKGENISFDDGKYPIDILYKLYLQTREAKESLHIENEEIFKKASGTIRLKYFENAENIGTPAKAWV